MPARPSQKPIWQCKFASPQEVAALGGVLVGSPTFAPGGGIKLTKNVSYVRFDAPSPRLNSTSSEGTTYKFVITSDLPFSDYSSNHLYLASMEIGSQDSYFEIFPLASYALQRRYNGAYGFAAQNPLFTAAWKEYEKNVLVVSERPGQCLFYVNGVYISAGVGITPIYTQPTDLRLGANSGGTNVAFTGTYHEFSVFEGMWSAEEAADDYNNATFHYQSKSVLYLDMAEQTVDPSGTYAVTKDKSPNGRLVRLGDGVTPASFPAFKNPGFQCTTTVIDLPPSVYSFASAVVGTWVFAFAPDFSPVVGTTPYLFATNAIRHGLYFEATVPNFRVQICGQRVTNNAVGDLWRKNGLNVFCAVFRTGAQTVYLNGFPWRTHTRTLAAETVTSAQLQGGLAGASCTHYHHSVYDFELTPIQVRELSANLQSEYGRL